jgi:hypothetical protein
MPILELDDNSLFPTANTKIQVLQDNIKTANKISNKICK